ncbi:uncharacterized protein CXorf58 homolog isoform X2 [Danio rerio]|uniref:Uncharacterized protein CXorf58 homolog isoform X2 n=7 Tax=Danio rerio TaxID=7955 RepID=A0AC58JNB0_DANRE|nr:putative uncharacterized protein CXorf58 homolog [Danio rerio]|eukprot:XP_021332053.1 putative uncharacterized protein CXorf58 homolog [Danio rerio]
MQSYEDCARKIQACWRSFRDRRLFRLLMNTVRSAEQCLASAVLRQLSPKEADLLKDPSLKCKLRFRFAGPRFPPSLVFKIFHTGGGRRQYLSGEKLLASSGQYNSHLDELPACVGGRENGWRFLSLKVLSRDVALKKRLKPGIRAFSAGGLNAITSHFAGQQLSHRSSQTSSRCSRRAKNTADRKRRLYGLKETRRGSDDEQGMKEKGLEKWDIIVLPSVETEDNDDSSSQSEWEDEAEKLCIWSEQLNIDAI